MRQATLTDWHNIEVQDAPIPVPNAGEAILRTAFVGICGSDVHIFEGTNPIATVPRVQGHEFCGEVHALGPNAPAGLTVGSRAAVYPLVTCGHCAACRDGRAHVCESLVVIGVNRDGGLAEYVRVPAENLIPVDPNAPDQVTVLTEPFSIGYHSLNRGRLAPGDAVLVIGAGPIGLYTAIVARARGAGRVVFSEINAKRQSAARAFGFEVVDPQSEDHLETLAGLTSGDGFQIVIETSGTQSGLNTGQLAAAISGRIVLLGFPSGRLLSYDITHAIVKEIELIGSRVCPREEFQATLELLQNLYFDDPAQFDTIIGGTFPLSSVAEAIEKTASAQTPGKLLIDPRAI